MIAGCLRLSLFQTQWTFSFLFTCIDSVLFRFAGVITLLEVDMISIVIFSKGHNSIKHVGDVLVLILV